MQVNVLFSKENAFERRDHLDLLGKKVLNCIIPYKLVAHPREGIVISEFWCIPCIKKEDII